MLRDFAKACEQPSPEISYEVVSFLVWRLFPRDGGRLWGRLAGGWSRRKRESEMLFVDLRDLGENE